MQYRKLGRTNLDVSEISIGLEWLHKKQQAEVTDVIKEAIKNGVNYFDVIFNFEEFLNQVSDAIKGHREKIILTHHLGSTEYKGKYKKSRSKKKCLEYFERYLKIMETEYVDILFIHFVLNLKNYDEVCKEGGIQDLAFQLKKEGKARFIGLSTHSLEVAIKAANSGLIDVIMLQINLSNHSLNLRQEFLAACSKNNVGVVAMKPFAGGKLLQANKKVNFASYVTGSNKSLQKKMPSYVTSHKCIHYILNQVGISTIVPGVATIDELHDCLNYYNISDEDRDFSQMLKDFNEYVKGECVYCNHCQPCPADIDIGLVNKLHDRAQFEGVETLQKEYDKLEASAKDCIECGDCITRCPFDVKVIERMRMISDQFD